MQEISPTAVGDQGLWSRLPTRSVLLHPGGHFLWAPSAEVSTGHPHPMDPAAFEKAGETLKFAKLMTLAFLSPPVPFGL